MNGSTNSSVMYVAGGVAIGVGIGMFISRNQSKTTKSTKPKQLEIAYWTIRGLGAPCRAMVMAADVELIATCYDVLPTAEGGFDRGIYGVQKKQNIKMNPLANLPYVIENGTMITQTNACLQYLGRRLDMMGDTQQEADDCNQLLCEAMDLRNNMTKVAYSTGDSSKACNDLINSQFISGSFKKLEAWLKAKTGSKVFFVGCRLSAADFPIWEMLDQFEEMSKYHSLESVLKRLPLCQTFYNHFSSMSENQKYFL